MSDIAKRCVECGTQVPTISETPLCSKDCQIEYAHRMVRSMSDDTAWCPTCHTEFDSIQSVCYHHNKSHTFDLHRTAICEQCGDVFRPTNSNNPSKYCSEECFGKDKTATKFEIECKNCGSLFKSLQNQRKFCSEDCYLNTEHNPFYQGGSSNIRRTAEYRQWRQIVHNKYDDCNKCGATENLQAHHIVPVSEDEELATDVDNGVLLCGECHSEEHPDMSTELFKNKVYL
jgi:hypothetical protein